MLLTVWGSIGLPAAPLSSPTLPADPARIARLRDHGLDTSAESLVSFLDRGFPPGTRFSELPGQPALKTQVGIDAMVELSRLRYSEAAPVFEKLARGEIPEGVRTLLEWDVAQQRRESRVSFEREIRRTLRLNAVVALGLVGTGRDTYTLFQIFKEAKDPDLKIPAALALATLGSGTAIPYLVKEVRRANRTTSVAAGDALTLITGRNLGPGADDPITRRKQAAKDWKDWAKTEGKTFAPKPAQIVARRTTPKVVPNRREPTGVHDLLDCMAYPEDPRWTIDPYEAHERLRAGGTTSMEELARVAQDKNENLKIRRQAIVMYTHLVTFSTRDSEGGVSDIQRRTYKLIRGLRWDRNPEIREVARQCADRLKPD